MKLICMSNNHMYKTSTGLSLRAGGLGISPGYYECGPQLLLLENRRKIEPKEISS